MRNVAYNASIAAGRTGGIGATGRPRSVRLSEREVRAARSVDAHQIRDAFRPVDAVGPLVAHVIDPALAIELRAWRQLRHLR